MNKRLLAVAVALGAAVVAGCNKQEEQAAADIKLETQEQKVSYIIAEDMANRLKMQEVDLDPKVVLLALEDVAAGRDSRLSEEEKAQTIQVFQEQMQKKQQEMIAKQEQEFEASAEKNQQEGSAYLAENGKKEGVVTTDSGLQYKVISKGEGAKPTTENEVEVHYRGRLLDGTEFDSSYQRGEPATFGLTQVIKGWTEVLQLMQEGDKWEVVIPPELAYGPRGAGGKIGPNATLIFEIELLKADASQAEEKSDASEAE